MVEKHYNIGDKVVMKKKHPCGGTDWKIVRVGADIKIECCTCGRIVMISRVDFNKKIKKVKED